MAKGVIPSLLDPVFGGDTSYEDEQARKAAERALGEWEGITAPELGNVDLARYDYLGDYSPTERVIAPRMDMPDEVNYEGFDPRLVDIEKLGKSRYEDISTDPRLREAQLAALTSMEDIADRGGMTMQDEANLSRIQSQVAQADKGRRQAIQQQQAMRGMSGSGLELLQQLQSSQAATDRASQAGLDVAGMAQARALQAIEKGGVMAGGVRGQDFSEQAQKAQAADAIARFNAANQNQLNQFQAQLAMDNAARELAANQWNVGQTMAANQFNIGNQMSAQGQNVSAANEAAYRNWMAQQDIANRNVGVSQQEHMQNVLGTPQQQFENQMNVAAGRSGAQGAQQSYWQNQGAQKSAKAAGYMSGAARIGAAAYTGGASEGVIAGTQAAQGNKPYGENTQTYNYNPQKERKEWEA